MKKIIFFGAFFTFVSLLAYSQQVTEQTAEAKLNVGNFEDALDEYLELIKIDSRNETYNYNIGLCYLNTNSNKAKAIPYLEIITRKNTYNHEADYLLGRAYHYNGRYDDAIKMFENYKTFKGKKDKNETDKYIQYCINAKELTRYPVNVSFQSLGNLVNSEYNDYYPFVTSNESMMIFNSNKPEKGAEKLTDGTFQNAIYQSKEINGQFGKAVKMPSPINSTLYKMEVIGLSAAGDVIILSQSNPKTDAQLFMSRSTGNGSYSKPQLIDEVINAGGDVAAAAISNDGNTIYFSSNKAGGLGGLDIYSCNKLSNGKWATPMNLGTTINTESDDDFPNISPDDKTLYFSSKGRSSMGGYDIFKSTIDETTHQFGSAKNMGYPINTPYDDMNFRVSKNGKFGYLAAIRQGGLGEYDVYRINFNEIETDYTVVIGEIKSVDNSDINFSDVFITVSDIKTKELVGNYLPNPANGRYVMILAPGKYQMNVEAPNYSTLEKPIEIFDKASYQAEINMNIELKK